MVTPAGLQRGLKTLLDNWKIDTSGMKWDAMTKIVSEMRDFKCPKTRVEELILVFLPKFHCELNPIEHVWYHAKQFTSSYYDYSFPNLKK